MKFITSFLLFIVFSAFAHAHTVGGTGFLAGLAHPVLGFEHFLAMVSVGIWSAQLGGRAIWSVPSTFVSFMIIGAILGIHNSLVIIAVLIKRKVHLKHGRIYLCGYLYS